MAEAGPALADVVERETPALRAERMELHTGRDRGER
jgi:hypothetical protein